MNAEWQAFKLQAIQNSGIDPVLVPLLSQFDPQDQNAPNPPPQFVSLLAAFQYFLDQGYTQLLNDYVTQYSGLVCNLPTLMANLINNYLTFKIAMQAAITNIFAEIQRVYVEQGSVNSVVTDKINTSYQNLGALLLASVNVFDPVNSNPPTPGSTGQQFLQTMSDSTDLMKAYFAVS